MDKVQHSVTGPLLFLQILNLRYSCVYSECKKDHQTESSDLFILEGQPKYKVCIFICKLKEKMCGMINEGLILTVICRNQVQK